MSEQINGLLREGESIELPEVERGSQEWAYGYNWAPIENSTHVAGNSVVLEVEPGGAVEPVLITQEIRLKIKTLAGKGLAVIYNTVLNGEVELVELDPSRAPIVLEHGDAYYYLNTGDEHLVLRDDCTPAFKGVEEIQLTAPPAEEGRVDGRTIQLPKAFWEAFGLGGISL